MRSPFVLWAYAPVDHAAALYTLEGVSDQYALNVGEPVLANFPDDAYFTMDPDAPYDTLLVDNLDNTDLAIVASPRLKEFLEGYPVAKVEYLPVTIVNHKGRPAARYYIVHPLDPVDCLDVPACNAAFGAVDKDNILDLERLVIDAGKVDPRRALFRPKMFYQVIVVRRALAEAVDAAGFTGVRWIELSDFPEV